MTAPRRLHLYHLWITLAALGFAVTLIAAWGEWRGWWKEGGDALALAGLALTIGFGLLGASSYSVARLGADLGGRLDQIYRLLEDRLPRP
jgi:hypothetical protein